MKNTKPPFEINEHIISATIEIAELVGRASINSKISSNPILRRTNRIRSIYSSLAIEQNTFDIEQITVVLSGKHIIESVRKSPFSIFFLAPHMENSIGVYAHSHSPLRLFP